MMSDRISEMGQRHIQVLVSFLILVFGVTYDIGLQTLLGPYATEGIYFQPWSSEDMMQTVSLRELRIDPFQTLLHIHIEPPGFDVIRAVLAQLWPSLNDRGALERVDYSIYLLWAAIFGLLGVVVFLQVSELCGIAVGILSALILLLHPASIYYATYLDATLLSSFLMLLAYYLLWKTKNGHSVSILLFSAVALALFFTRSLFQLPFIFLLALSLFLVGVPSRQTITYLLVAGLISTVYVAKQRYLFGIFSTSSFVGYNLANSIGAGIGPEIYTHYLDSRVHLAQTYGSLPEVLIRKTKISGQPNFNNIEYLYLNGLLLSRYEKKLLSTSAGELARSYLENLVIYSRPSSAYGGGNVIVDSLPWTNLYNRVFSAPVLPILLVLAMAVWGIRVLKARSYARALGLVLPGSYVFLISVIGDKGENMRFKFLLEPVMWLFLVSQFWGLARTAHGYLSRRSRPS